jgi:hypothetical protein
MDEDRIELLRRLFVAAAEAAEAASAAAMDGQAQYKSLRRYRTVIERLESAAHELSVLAQAAAVLAQGP